MRIRRVGVDWDNCPFEKPRLMNRSARQRLGQVHDFHSRQEINRHPLKRSESLEALLTIHL
jgi:hypothetical protein